MTVSSSRGCENTGSKRPARLKSFASARHARRIRQAACTTVSASSSSRSSRGASAVRSSARNRRKSPASSSSTTAVRAVSPCRRAFRLDTALPAAVLGPVLFKALRRLAAIWAAVAMVLSTEYGACGPSARLNGHMLGAFRRPELSAPPTLSCGRASCVLRLTRRSSRAPLCGIEGRAWLRMREMIDGAMKIAPTSPEPA